MLYKKFEQLIPLSIFSSEFGSKCNNVNIQQEDASDIKHLQNLSYNKPLHCLVQTEPSGPNVLTAETLGQVGGRENALITAGCLIGQCHQQSIWSRWEILQEELLIGSCWHFGVGLLTVMFQWILSHLLFNSFVPGEVIIY